MYVDGKRHSFGNFELDLLKVPNVSSTDKVVYLYMRHKFAYLTSIRKEYFESLESIGEGTGLSRSTVIRAINSLEKIGWLNKSTTRTIQGTRQTKYKILSWEYNK